MATESERCVDELLKRQLYAEKLLARFQNANSQDYDGLILEARSVVTSTQAFIDNNISIIPSYCLKKATDALRKLDVHIDKPKKKSFQFKFKAPSHQTSDGNGSSHAKSAIKVGANDKEPISVMMPDALGFHDKTKQTLCLGKEEVSSKDVSLVNLHECTVKIIGPANTVYIRNLTDSTVTVFLACRAITITNCKNCRFKLVCQQLRIDSTFLSKFNIFTSARSMLESSKELEFANINLDGLDDLNSTEINELLKLANFNKLQNNWKCIDDFDWLSPNSASKNFRLAEEK